MKQTITTVIEQLDTDDELSAADLELLNQARSATQLAYAPYSNFKVGAAARLSGGGVVLGSNQENASYGATICAERVLLASLSVTHPSEHVTTIAISYNNIDGLNSKPISPCGICRQSLLEHEINHRHQLRIIMSGLNGKVWIVDSATSLLPLGFSRLNME